MMCESVVLPRPGGPNRSTWSIASPRIRAAPMKISSCSRAFAWPTYSARPFGRSARSIASSFGEFAAPLTTRAAVPAPRADAGPGANSSVWMVMAHYRACRRGCRDNQGVQRHRAASRLTSWLFVAALLLKSAVPMLASAAAASQGRATADVCDVYGVDTSMLGGRSLATAAATSQESHRARRARGASRAWPAHVHHAEQAHDASHSHRADSAPSAAAAERAPAHGPASRVAHGADHCALSALAFALAADAPSVALRPATPAPMPADRATSAPVVDPAARWVAQLQHAPPASS